jgi:hypothetical protein
MKMSARSFLILAGALAFGTASMLGAQEWLLATNIGSHEGLPVQGESAPLEPKLSNISVVVRMALSALASRINSTIPADFSGDVPVNIPVAHATHATYTVHREPFVFGPDGSGGIAYSVNVGANGAVHYRWAFDQEHNPFQAAATISGELKPEIAADWQIHPNVSTRVDVHQASVNFIRNISVRGLLTDRISAALPGLIGNGVTQINGALKLRDQVTAYWAQAYRTIEISGNPMVYIQLAPTAIRIQQARCGPDGILAAGLSLDCMVRTFIGSKPEDVKPVALASPSFVTNVEPLFHLNVPVTISLEEIARVLQDHLGAMTFAFEGNRSLKINEIALGSSGDKVLVRMKVEAVAGLSIPRLEGEVTIEGVPTLSEDGATMRFERLAYTLDSKNELVVAAEWLLHPVVLQQLEDVLRLDVHDKLEEAKVAANGQIVSKLRAGAFQPVIIIRDVTAGRVIIAKDKLVCVFDASGTCELDVNL